MMTLLYSLGGGLLSYLALLLLRRVLGRGQLWVSSPCPPYATTWASCWPPPPSPRAGWCWSISLIWFWPGSLPAPSPACAPNWWWAACPGIDLLPSCFCPILFLFSHFCAIIDVSVLLGGPAICFLLHYERSSPMNPMYDVVIQAGGAGASLPPMSWHASIPT